VLLVRLRDARARLAVGVVVAIVLGFVPAHLVASARESSELRAIDDRVAVVQADADSQDSYDALDAFRTKQLELKQHKRTMIMLSSLVIWALVGGAIGYVWVKRLPWHRLD